MAEQGILTKEQVATFHRDGYFVIPGLYGGEEMAGGHHRKGLIGSMWEPMSDEDIAGMDFKVLTTAPGDAVFFDSFAPHRSGPNDTNEPRRVLYTTYNRLSAGDFREQYYREKRANFPPDCERDPDKSYAFRV